MEKRLPAGQFELKEFPRFGLSRFAPKFPANPDQIRFEIVGDVEKTLILEGPFEGLSRQERTEDFHCVTTWSARGQKWGGVAFSEFFDKVVLQQARPEPGAELVVFRGEDGYCSSLPLQDLMADGVLLADQLNGERLGIEHGAPLRLVAPAHYGYKNVKHIVRIEFWPQLSIPIPVSPLHGSPARPGCLRRAWPLVSRLASEIPVSNDHSAVDCQLQKQDTQVPAAAKQVEIKRSSAAGSCCSR